MERVTMPEMVTALAMNRHGQFFAESGLGDWLGYDNTDGGAPGGTGWCSRPGAGCGVPAEFFCAGAERREADNG